MGSEGLVKICACDFILHCPQGANISKVIVTKPLERIRDLRFIVHSSFLYVLGLTEQ